MFTRFQCCLIAFLNLTENKLRTWTVKYGRRADAARLLDEYNRFVVGNDVFREFDKAMADMRDVVREYVSACGVGRRDTAAVDAFMRRTADRWRSVATELRCARSMLEEVVAYWTRWTSVSGEVRTWLAGAGSAPDGPNDNGDDDVRRAEYFQVLETVGRTRTSERLGGLKIEIFRYVCKRWDFTVNGSAK